MKRIRSILSIIMVLALLASMAPVYAAQGQASTDAQRSVQNAVTIDDDPTGGYTGDYVVIYNPGTTTDTRSTGNMSGLIQTSVNAAVNNSRRAPETEDIPYIIDIDGLLAESEAQEETKAPVQEPVRASYSVGSTKTFTVNSNYSPTGSSSIEFKCLYVGEHCYIWTPTSTNNTYPLDNIDSSFAKKAADEFDSKFSLMQSSFGAHTNGTSGDGKLNMLYYNINDGWQPGQGYVAGFFWGTDLTNNGVPLLNIDTYPGVYYKNASGVESKRIDGTFSTMVHEYQHLICYSNTRYMSTWLNECFSAAAEEICYPGSSVISRIQSWENYYYSDNNDWLNPPAEFQYSSDYNLHNGYSMYAWNNNLDDILALYAQVSFFAQYLYTQFGNTIYKQISSNWSMNNEVAAITAATGMSCSDLVRNFRVAVTANAAQSLYNGVYGFKAQPGFDSSKYHNLTSPWDLLAPVVFTGTNCSIQGGGAITVKPVNGVYYPPSGADANLQYVGIKFSAPYTITAVSNNSAWGTVSVNGYEITATPAAGYYVASCDVTSGTAITSLNVNKIIVSPSSNCTIRVNFAQKPTYTVNYVVNGQTASTQSAKVYDTITLPSTVSVNPSGWSFCGWTAQQLQNEVSVQPEFYAPGASYTVTGNVNLHALYTRREGNAPLSYKLVETAPADWSGNYVISNGTTSSMFLLKGVNVSGNGENVETSANATNVATAGATLEGGALYNVDDLYVYTLLPRGNSYSMQNVSTGLYYGMNAREYISGYLDYTSSNCDWTPGVGANASSMKCASGQTYPYLGFTTISNKFWASSSPDTTIRLWKATGGYIDYYHTSPSGTTHTHSYGDWTSNNNGTHSRSCSCGDTQTESCTYTDVVTAPTATSQGYTTHTCTVCGYSFRDSYTDPVAPTTYYTVKFSVPSGVSAIANQTVASGNSISLPTAGAVSGYSFIGWTTAAVAETTARPTVLTGSYAPSANVTLYAVYTRTEGGSGVSGYQLLTETPANWEGNYVITSSSVNVLKGINGTANGTSVENENNAPLYSDVGMTLADNVLTGVDDAYVFTMEANGSGYSLKNAATGSYLGLASNSYGALVAYSAYTADYCVWTPSMNENGKAQLLNAKGGSYPYLGYSTNYHYFWSASATLSNSIQLWKQTLQGGTTYYTTAPVNPSAVLPVITSQPKSVSVSLNDAVSFSVAATGENLSYQWQYKRKNASAWTTWSGKTAATLSFKAISANNGCQYRCVVTNAAGSVTSNAATLTILADNKPVITSQPSSVTVGLGNTVSFSVAATGENLSYQWQYKRKNASAWTTWSGKTAATLNFKAISSNNGCQYRCVVTNAAGSVTSNAATLTISNSAVPVITSQPRSVNAPLSGSVSFSVAATGENLSYQWQYKRANASSWSTWSGKTDATLSFKAIATNNGCQYRCVVTNAAGSVTSEAATLSITNGN